MVVFGDRSNPVDRSAQCGGGQRRARADATGVNVSPTFNDPFAETVLRGGEIRASGLRDFLQQGHALHTSESVSPSIAAAVHLVCPALHFLDRGKSRLSVPAGMVQPISDAL